MAYNTGILQGSFVGTGNAVFIPLRSGVDWMWVLNTTVAAGGAAVGSGYRFDWQSGMQNAAAGSAGFSYTNPAVPVYAPLAVGGGFLYQDTSVVTYTFSPAVITNIAAGANATITSAAHGLQTGDIVRLLNLASPVEPLSAINWIVTRTGANTFTIPCAASNVGSAAPGANSQIVKISREGLYVPQDRVIVSISQAANAVITFAAPHNFTVGQDVRININPITNAAVYSYLRATYGAQPSLAPQATVTAVNSNISISINLNTVAMPAFAFPLQASVPFGPSQVTPIGEDTGYALTAGVNILGDSTNNIAQIGMLLAPGVNGPAGSLNDQIFWKAGVSFSNILGF